MTTYCCRNFEAHQATYWDGADPRTGVVPVCGGCGKPMEPVPPREPNANPLNPAAAWPFPKVKP